MRPLGPLLPRKLPNREPRHRLHRPLERRVEVDARGRDGPVSHELLDDAEIGAVPEQLGRECVTEGVRVSAAIETRAGGESLHDVSDRTWRDGLFPEWVSGGRRPE